MSESAIPPDKPVAGEEAGPEPVRRPLGCVGVPGAERGQEPRERQGAGGVALDLGAEPAASPPDAGLGEPEGVWPHHEAEELDAFTHPPQAALPLVEAEAHPAEERAHLGAQRHQLGLVVPEGGEALSSPKAARSST